MSENKIDTNKSMLMRVGVLFLGVATLLLATMMVSEVKSYQYIGSDSIQEATISVSGQGEVLAKPDTGEFTVQIEEEADTVPAAQELATEKTNNVLSYLQEQDVAEENIKTTSYNIRPRYEFRERQAGSTEGERVLVGYVVSQSLEVKVENTEKAGELLSGIGGLEVSNVSGLNFTLDDEEAAENEARDKAIAKAKQKAGVLADQLGVDLVQVVDFQESGDDQPRPVRYTQDAAGGAVAESAAAPSVPTGENKFTSNVTITYKIR